MNSLMRATSSSCSFFAWRRRSMPRLALAQVVRVVAGVLRQRAQVDLDDASRDRVEEVAVVRDQDDRSRVLDEVLLEPVARVEVEVVRGLVQQQQLGPAQQQLGQRDAHLPAARERLGRARRGRCSVNPSPRSTVATRRSIA